MKASMDIITTKYGHIYFQRCVVHAMNLFLGDLAKTKWIKDVVKHKKFNLVISGKTRFG